MNDIIKRLRTLDFIYYPNDAGDIALEAANEIERLREALRLMPKTITDAADEIERLRAENEQLRKDYALAWENHLLHEQIFVLTEAKIKRLRDTLSDVNKGINQWLPAESMITRALLERINTALEGPQA